jgi:hypothetical protein
VVAGAAAGDPLEADPLEAIPLAGDPLEAMALNQGHRIQAWMGSPTQR